MPRSLKHESEQEPCKWVYTPSSMNHEGNNRAKREAPARTGQEHAARETKTTKVNSIMWLHIRSWNIIILIIMMITTELLVKSSLESELWFTVLLIIAMIPKRHGFKCTGFSPWIKLWNLLLGQRTKEGRTSRRFYGKIRDSEQSGGPQAIIPPR